MCQAVLSPNLTKKFQCNVSQIADNRFPCVMLLGGLSVNLNHLKTVVATGRILVVSLGDINVSTFLTMFALLMFSSVLAVFYVHLHQVCITIKHPGCLNFINIHLRPGQHGKWLASEFTK